VFDAGYDPIQLALDLGDLNARSMAMLVRLRRNRCFASTPILIRHWPRQRAVRVVMGASSPAAMRRPG
jgi:hypothetical protein